MYMFPCRVLMFCVNTTGESGDVGAGARRQRGYLQRPPGEGHQDHHDRAQARHLLHRRGAHRPGFHGRARRER